MELSRTSRPVAPGTRLTSFQRLESDKWLRADALSMKLGSGSSGGDSRSEAGESRTAGENSETHGSGETRESSSEDGEADGGTRADYLSSGEVSTRKPLSELADSYDPGKGRRTVAAFNADFFDIDETGAPLGPGIRDGHVTHSPAPGNSEALGFGPDAAGRVLGLYFEGTLTLPSGKQPLTAYNAANVPENGVGAYNSRWGSADRDLTTDRDPDSTEVRLRQGRVTEVLDEPGSGPIADGTTVLIGRDAAAKSLDALKAGDRVSLEYHARTADGSAAPRTAVGGRGLLVVDGQAQNWEGRPNNEAAPRTAVGFSKDGTTMHVISVDGRQAASGGVTLTELGLMMRDLGAYNALNLDGGGSSTLLVREPGAEKPQLENSPSDGEEREVPNGLALTAPEGSGELRDFWVETAADPKSAPTADNMPVGHPERVFPGLTRKLTAAGYDESYGPAKGDPRWSASRPAVGKVDGSGVFHARHAGSTRVSARQGEADGSTRLSVVGGLSRIQPTHERVGLADGADEGSFGIVGFDAGGTSAPVDPADARLEYDSSLFSVSPDDASGGFTVKARPQESGSGIVTVDVQGHKTRLAVTVGLHDEKTASFDDAADWKFSAARAEGSLAADPNGREGMGLRMTYDFGRSTATRAAYATPPKEVPVPGQPSSFTMWIKSDGKGAWPSLHLKDAAGTDQVLRGEHLTEEGWQQVTFEVPETVTYPLRLHRFYLAETRPAEQYAGEVVLDELTARVPPDVELPESARPHDPLISTAADVAGRDWRFAVVSDAQFVARDPDSAVVRQARRTLREIRAARPDFVIVNGDLVDEGSKEDLRFARRVLEEELGDSVEWTYVPGNHEVMGGSIADFTAEFGPAQRTFDHKGTRFVTLDTSSLTIRGGGYAQFQELRRQLDDAADDPSVSSVVVVEHVPPRDPTGQQASRLTDRMEADLLEDWLSRFRARSGKGAAFVGSHVGVFDASRVGGVPYLVNGNSGKAPAAPPGSGGFTGWSLLGVDQGRAGQTSGDQAHGDARGGRDWIAAQTRPHVDALTMRVPDGLRVGESAQASATVVQGSGESARKVPVGWPVSADWSGSGNLCVKGGRSAADDVRTRCAASYDPRTGTLTAHRPGTVTLAVEVSGERAERQVTIAR
ncbi:phosphodiester glycosidase family protein [Streptomyces marispadix]|uniref:Phosphodiester glycosidase family protein n=1 Tax=Streptomyces marispadix TaxID=2922868 RepID=A0ABS9STP6_9ACTN|nr:phosphodiester glycosidase family protein [Streptomyces marispadix]MCH6159665.1 phosphodiester glycosidase family protein [Streptomyces marispadix]